MDQSNIPYPILVSACLCGAPCRYDGRAGLVPALADLCAAGLAVPVCPEVLGGLPIPRVPCEIRGEIVVDRSGVERTEAFVQGAAKVLATALALGVSLAVLKEKSPSCGVYWVYDGSFSSRLVPGQGVTTALLRENGIAVISDEEFSR